MKISLVTQNTIRNYGSNLQAYALVETIKKMGCEVEILNYWPNESYKYFNLYYFPYEGSIFLKIKRLIRNLYYFIFARSLKLSYQRFDSFRKQYLPQTQIVYLTEDDILSNPPDCDTFVVGSDCLWYPNDAKNNGVRYLSMAHKLGKRAVSYAPSLTYNKMPDADISEIMANYFKDIDFLSSRERVGCEIVSKISGRECVPTLDPTLLFNATWWNHLIDKARLISGDYILAYTVHDSPLFRKSLKRLRKQTGLPIVMLSISMVHSIRMPYNKLIMSAGPKEFLNLIYNAKYVVSGSFHAIAFSIIFKKTFYAIPVKKNDSRITDILSRFDLDSQMILSVEQISSDLKPDYSSIDEKMDSQRNDSLMYLKNSIFCD